MTESVGVTASARLAALMPVLFRARPLKTGELEVWHERLTREHVTVAEVEAACEALAELRGERVGAPVMMDVLRQVRRMRERQRVNAAYVTQQEKCDLCGGSGVMSWLGFSEPSDIPGEPSVRPCTLATLDERCRAYQLSAVCRCSAGASFIRGRNRRMSADEYKRQQLAVEWLTKDGPGLCEKLGVRADYPPAMAVNAAIAFNRRWRAGREARTAAADNNVPAWLAAEPVPPRVPVAERRLPDDDEVPF